MVPVQTHRNGDWRKPLQDRTTQQVSATQRNRKRERVLVANTDTGNTLATRCSGSDWLVVTDHQIVACQIQRPDIPVQRQQTGMLQSFQRLQLPGTGMEGQSAPTLEIIKRRHVKVRIPRPAGKQPVHLDIRIMIKRSGHRPGAGKMPITRALHTVENSHNNKLPVNCRATQARLPPSRAPASVSNGK